MEKIVTHAGTFHADEICAIATIRRIYPEIPVERTFTPAESDFSDPAIFVLDIGRQYDPARHNFDHHHDPSLPATNVLILEALFPLGEGNNARLRELLMRHFYAYIDRVDRGEVVENADTPPTINSIVRACNNLENGFDVALSIMQAAVDAQFATAFRRIESEEIWAGVERRGHMAINDSERHIVGWHELAEADGITHLVSPNPRGGYQITSRDSARWPIPPHPAQTFRHNSGFIAAYPDLETAINHAAEISAGN